MDIKKINGFIEEISRMGREKQKSFLTYSLSFFRKCILIFYGNEYQTKFTNEEQHFVSDFNQFIHPGNIQSLYSEINDAQFHVERNANTNILFMDLSLKIGKLLKMNQ